MCYVVIIRGYEDHREQYSLIITASQWRFHHQSLSWPQITTFISCCYSLPNPKTRRNKSLMALLSHVMCTYIVITRLHVYVMSPVSVYMGRCARYVNLSLCFPQKAGCVVSGCNSALLKVCLCICLSHLEQCFVLEKTCGGGLFALKSMCLTNCGSSTESVSQRTTATSPTSFDMNWFGLRVWKTEDATHGNRQRDKRRICASEGSIDGRSAAI